MSYEFDPSVLDNGDAYYEQLIYNAVHDRPFDQPIGPPDAPTTAAAKRVEETNDWAAELEAAINATPAPTSGIAAALARADAQHEKEETPLIEYRTLEELQASLAAEPDEDYLPDPDYGVLEQSIMDLVLDSPGLIGQHNIKLLRPDHFRDHAHRCIIVAWLEFWDKYQQVPTRLLVHNQILRMKPDEVEGVREAAELAEKSHSTPLEREVARKHLGDWMKRQIVKELHTEESFMILKNCGPEAFASWVREVMDKANMVGADTRKERFKIIDSDEFDANSYELDYLIPGVLVKDQPAVIAGPKKGLKTTISIDLAVALAKGGYFLGKWHVPKRTKVLVVSAESGNATLKDTARRVCRAAKCQLRDLKGWLLWAEDAAVPKLQDDMDMAEFVRVLQQIKPGVVILDPLYKMHSGDGAESIYKMGGPLERLGRACLDNGATPVVLHHLKSIRGNPFDPADLDDMSYAGCAEYFRQWILVNRRAKYEPNSGHHEMWLTIGGSAGHSSEWSLDVEEGIIADEGGRRWQTSFLRSDEAREVAKVEKVKAKEAEEQGKMEGWIGDMTRFLAMTPEGRSENQIKELSGISKRQVMRVLAEMEARGLVEPTKVGANGNNRKHPGWKNRTAPHV